MGYSCRIFRMPMPAAKWGLVGLHMPSSGTTFGIPHDQFIIHSSVFWLRN